MTTLFRCLGDAGVPYCVLRNHQGLPYRNVATDLDLLVSPAAGATALRCVSGVAGTVVTGRVRRAAATHLFVAGVDWDGHNALEVDVMTGVVWKGVPYLDAEGVLARSHPAAPERALVMIPDPVDEAVISFLSSFLVGGWIKERYQPQVREVFADRTDEVVARLQRFGTAPAARLAALVAAGDDAAALEMVPELRRRLLLGALRRRPAATAGRLARHYRREAQIRWTRRYVDDVYLAGGDPAGRAAFAAELARAVAHMAKDVRVVPPRPGIRSRLSRRVPGVRNRALRIWVVAPGGRAPDGLVLWLGAAGEPDVVALPAEPAARRAAAVAAVRDHLARGAARAAR